MLKNIFDLLPVKVTKKISMLSSHIEFPKVKFFVKLIHKNFTKFTKLSLVLAVGLYLFGYQPTLAIPPIKKSLVYAEFTQEQSINAASFSEAFQLPHPGYISTYFSAYHPGIDIATGLGMPIHPILKGTVVDVSYGFFGLGHSITVEHEQNLRSTYGHLGRIFVKTGESVSSASTLGEVGLTGHTSGPHTHLEVTKDGKYINPLTILPPLPDMAQTLQTSATKSASIAN